MGVAARPGASPGFLDRLRDLAQRIDCHRAENFADWDAIFRLRYDAYLRERTIGERPSRRVADRADGAANAYVFGLWLDGRLASSIRVHVASPEHPDTPAAHVFPEFIEPALAAGKTIVDPTRFVADYDVARINPELPYLTVRLAYIATGYFRADLGIATVRAEHQAFYRRLMAFEPVCPPRPYPGLIKPISLMSVDVPALREHVAARYPFFRHSAEEAASLFGHVQAAPPLSPVPGDLIGGPARAAGVLAGPTPRIVMPVRPLRDACIQRG
ncbi:MAG TPA: hypothetical protein VHD15_02475 [Hyphomicrobiales bacterium]|nr:hypothetical protein [Hyphomicrobiales bacterium]